MKFYNVIIKETLKRTVEIEAVSKEDAKDKVIADYYGEKYILDSSDFVEVKFI